MKHNRREWFKSGLLAALSVLTVLLLAVAWSYNLQGDSADGWLDRVLLALGIGGAGDSVERSLPTAALPVTIAAREEGALYSVSYGGQVATVYERAAEHMGQALSAAGAWSQVEEEEALAALEGGRLLLFSYEGAVPLSLIAGWMDAPQVTEEEPVSALLLLDREDGSRLLLRSAEDGAWYGADSTANMESLAALLAGNLMVESEFAAGYALDSVAAESALGGGVLSLVTLQAQAPVFTGEGTDDLQQLLTAFSYNPYAVRDYSEDQGASRVFVSTYSTLEIGQDGRVFFESTDLRGAISAGGDDGESETQRYNRCSELAVQVLQQALESIDGEGFALTQVRQQDNLLVLDFERRQDNVTLKRADGQPMARFEFQDGALVRATLCLEKLSAGGQSHALLPALQAAATAPLEGGPYRLALRYEQEEGGAYQPKWVLLPVSE